MSLTERTILLLCNIYRNIFMYTLVLLCRGIRTTKISDIWTYTYIYYVLDVYYYNNTMDKYNNAFRVSENFSKSSKLFRRCRRTICALRYISPRSYIDVSVGLELNQQRDADRKKKRKKNTFSNHMHNIIRRTV